MMSNAVNRTKCTGYSRSRLGVRIQSVLVGASIATGLTLFSELAIAQTLTQASQRPNAIWTPADSNDAEAASDEPAAEPAAEPESGAVSDSDILQQAEALAAQAQTMTQSAATAAQWDEIAVQWIEAIALLQSISPESPARVMAQRQFRNYLQQLQDVQRRAEQASSGSGPSLGSDLFDAQLAGYLSYVATVGTPDVLLIGSSRTLQGIDPLELQQALSSQGYDHLKVFNFSVNGATAQVMEFVVSELLPQPLPPIIVWGDGSRALNEGRRDRTWEKLLASPGYRTTQNAAVPVAVNVARTERTQQRVTANDPLVAVPGNLDVLGFSAVSDRFDPQTYYQQVSRVEGRYDGAYAGFSLNGAQAAAMGRLATTLQQAGSQLMFVNLPLSASYLDDYRLYYERQFQRFLQAQSAQYGFEVVDLLTQWDNQPGLFADPSHINQDGAKEIARQLAQTPAMVNALAAGQSPETSSDPVVEATPDESPAVESSSTESLLDLLRAQQPTPAQNEPARRSPPPIPPPPTVPADF